MNILGLQKTTLLDYPGKVAATIFLGGCNMRCSYCHNMNLVEMSAKDPIPYDEVMNFLSKRRNLLDGVCITGGEPTLYNELVQFIRDIKSLSYLVKLDTNGTNPDMLKHLVENNLIDYIAMDIKSSIDTYASVCGTNVNTNNVLESIDFLKKNNVPYEFRTTLVSEYHTLDVMENIGQMLSGANCYYLQSFVDSEYVPNHQHTALTSDILLQYKNLLSKYITNVEIRGVDIEE